MTDATPENGCPWIAPGLHKQGTLEHHWTPLGFDCVGSDSGQLAPLVLPVKAGSVAVFSSLTPHRTGPNLTDDIRKSYILQYAADGAVGHARDNTISAANDPDRQFFILGE